MPNDSGRSDRTAAPFPQGVVALSLVAMLSTASPQTPTVFEEADPIHVPAIDPPMATAYWPASIRSGVSGGDRSTDLV